MDEAKSNRPEEWVRPEVEQVAVAAATVVLIRDASEGIEVLLARRNSKIYFAGGAWVFPGGRIDAEDHGTDFAGEHFDEAH
jgi:8-oxo-dGTP pyrophosphatase MutT (NUDIX family)